MSDCNLEDANCRGADFEAAKFSKTRIYNTDLGSTMGLESTIHDGPGIRSTVFMKGCPLSCQWCHNPESHSLNTELLFRQERCLACGSCIPVCPDRAISLIDGKIFTDRERCTVQGECVKVCYPGAREIVGREVTPEEVVADLARDRVFYDEA